MYDSFKLMFEIKFYASVGWRLCFNDRSNLQYLISFYNCHHYTERNYFVQLTVKEYTSNLNYFRLNERSN